LEGTWQKKFKGLATKGCVARREETSEVQKPIQAYGGRKKKKGGAKREGKTSQSCVDEETGGGLLDKGCFFRGWSLKPNSLKKGKESVRARVA